MNELNNGRISKLVQQSDEDLGGFSFLNILYKVAFHCLHCDPFVVFFSEYFLLLLKGSAAETIAGLHCVSYFSLQIVTHLPSGLKKKKGFSEQQGKTSRFFNLCTCF